MDEIAKARKELITKELFHLFYDLWIAEKSSAKTTESEEVKGQDASLKTSSVIDDEEQAKVSCTKSSEKDLAFPDNVLANRFKIICKLGEGGYGQIFKASDSQTNLNVVVKFALKKETEKWYPAEVTEGYVMGKFQTNVHCPRLYACYMVQGRQCTVMELLGQNVSDLRYRCRLSPKRLSISATHRIVFQMVEAIEGLHEIGYVHRDIKPGNIVTGGHLDNRYTFFLIDFDQVLWYKNPDGTHKLFKSVERFVGTFKYASITAQQYYEQSRRDDLISLFYTYCDLLTASLPWRKSIGKFPILDVKQKHTLSSLAKIMLPESMEFANHVTSLAHATRPNYQLLKDTLNRLMQRYNIKPTDPFDWDMVTNCSLLKHFDVKKEVA